MANYDDNKYHSDSDKDFGLPNEINDPIDFEDEFSNETFKTNTIDFGSTDSNSDLENRAKLFNSENVSTPGNKSGGGALLISLIILFLLIVASLLYIYNKDKPKNPNKKIYDTRNESDDSLNMKVIEDTVVDAEPTIKVVPPNITYSDDDIAMLTTRTGKYYIIIGSFLDEDVAKDFCKKLMNKGESPVIIKGTYKKVTMYRVSIASYNLLREAQTALPSFVQKTNNESWVLRY